MVAGATHLYVRIAESFGCPVERVLHGMDGEVPDSGILLDLSTEGALEPGVAGSFVVRVVRGRDIPSPRRLGCGGDLGRRRDELACHRSR